MARLDRYVVHSTRAFVTTHDAVQAVNAFVQRIPHDQWSPAWRPKYSSGREGPLARVFECKLTLPEPVGGKSYRGSGPTKDAAKAAAAFLAIQDLHQARPSFTTPFSPHFNPV